MPLYAQQSSMITQAAKGPPKKQKQLACKRCRHRKQKCNDARPCDNCTQSGTECLPSESAASKPFLENGYVQRLEERVAQLESLIPQESLDHIDALHGLPRQHSAFVSTPRQASTVPRRTQEGAVDTSASGRAVPQSSLGRQPSRESVHQMDRNMTQQQNTAHAIPVTGSPPWGGEQTRQPPAPGNFGSWADIHSQLPASHEADGSEEAIVLGSEMQVFLIQTYFEMAHSQYPILLKHEFLQWADTWQRADGEPCPADMWKGFFIYMVYSIGFLMTKSRINGPTRSRVFHRLATSRYWSSVMASSDTLIRAQAFLILTLHALHMPSQEAILSLSSRSIRFCVASQLHLDDSETLSRHDSNDWLRIQHRRRIFWCAYVLDRVVSNSHYLPYSIPESHITVPMFDNIDDDMLSAAATSVAFRAQMLGSNAPSSISSAHHIFRGRLIESEIQEMVLRKDFVGDAEESFQWRAGILEKLKQWNRQSATFTEPTQNGYVSLRWHKMIYYYGIVMLYRPTRTTVRGISGDLSVQACCQALLLFRKFQMAKEIARPWLGLLSQFQIGITMLYCFFATPPAYWPASYKSSDVPDAVRACSSILAVLAERWAEVESIRDTFEILAKEIPLGETWERPARISETGQRIVDENWAAVSSIVLHRPTLNMIREMASTPFADISDMDTDAEQPPPEAAMDVFDGMDLQWAHPMHTLPLDMDAGVYLDGEY